MIKKGVYAATLSVLDENGSLGLKETSGQVKEFMTGDILEVYE